MDPLDKTADQGELGVDRRVLFLGDSHTAGVGDPSGLGWVGQMVAESFRMGKPLTAYNLGVCGDTSEDVLLRLPHELSARLKPAGRYGLVLAVGGNDTTFVDGTTRVAESRSCDVLETILELASTLAIDTFVVGPAPVGDGEQIRRIVALSDQFMARCRNQQVSYVDLVGDLLSSELWHAEIAQDDGAHPASRVTA